MKWLKDRLKDSYFIINKLYVFLIFIWLTIADTTLGIVYFLISLIVIGLKTLRAKIPMKPKKNFNKKTLVYKETDDIDLKVDLWYPDHKKDSYPLVYFCHGGGWISGFRNQPNNISWCKFLANKGYAVASIDYRYGYKNSMADILSDYTDGLNFLRANRDSLQLDMDNITLMGLSAGGHLSLLYSTYYSWEEESSPFMAGVNAVVAYYSPSNLKDILIDDNKSLFARFAIKKTLQDSPSEMQDVYAYYSPITYLTSNMVPVFLAHGEEDNTVPFISSVNFAKKLDSLGLEYEFLIHKTADHSFDTSLKDYATINIVEKTATFIKKHNKKNR